MIRTCTLEGAVFQIYGNYGDEDMTCQCWCYIYVGPCASAVTGILLYEPTFIYKMTLINVILEAVMAELVSLGSVSDSYEFTSRSGVYLKKNICFSFINGKIVRKTKPEIY